MNKSVRNVVVCLAVMFAVLAMAGSGFAQTARDGLLTQYAAQEKVKPADNKIGLSIESVGKWENSDGYLIQWNSPSDINHAFVVGHMYFFDPEDFTNQKSGFESEFQGNIGVMNRMIVTPDKPAKFLIIYFQGIDKSVKGSEPYVTAPLFFMVELGDNPGLLEVEPRYAGDLFEQHIKKPEK